jgi:PqqD family protein of HPr-rel-A system
MTVRARTTFERGTERAVKGNGETAGLCKVYPLRRADVRMHELDGEALVFDPATADTHRLNQTALFIWRQCDGRRDADEIAGCLVEAYEVSHPAAVGYVERILEELRERNLVRSAGDTDV